MNRIAVIGSGIGAMSAARALVARGVKPVIIDVGESLPEKIVDLLKNLRQRSPERWNSRERDLLRYNDTLGSRDLPLKALFGSTFHYAGSRPFAPTEWTDDTELYPTYARGGFSNAWAGAVMPYDDRDLSEWPLNESDLSPYYQKVLEGRPLVAARDALDQRAKLYSEQLGHLQNSGPVENLLKRAETNKQALTDAGIHLGHSRLMVHTQPTTKQPGCVQCGLCLSGCPVDAVYTAREELHGLLDGQQVEYLSNSAIIRFEELADCVMLEIQNTQTNSRETICFERVFLGAGIINSSRIVMHSLGWYNQPLQLCGSDKFLLPMLQFRGSAGIFDQVTHEFPGAFMEIQVPELDDHWIHFQLSAINRLALAKLGLDPYVWPKPLQRLLAIGFGRLIFGWCGVQDTLSAKVSLTLKQRVGTEPLLLIRGEPHTGSEQILKRSSKTLMHHRRLLGCVPLPFLARYAKPGFGNHHGGSFPMRQENGDPVSSDLLGRPAGLKRVHLVDSSSFPGVAGSTIGLTIMANAYRIADQVTLSSGSVP